MPRAPILLVLVTLVLVAALAVAQTLPRCSTDVLRAAEGRYGAICKSRTNASDGSIIYAMFCADSDCRVYYAQLSKAYMADCLISGVSLKTYLLRIGQACPDIRTETVPPITTTSKPTSTRTPTPTATRTPSQAPTPTPTPLPQMPENAETNTAAVVGAVVGPVVAIVIGSVILLIILRKRKKSKDVRLQGAPSEATYVAVSDATPTATTQTRSVAFQESHTLVPYQIPYDRIKFGRVINHGTFGQIFRATYDGNDVAVKRLLPSRRDDPHSLHQFMNEIRLTATLQHECIVRFIGAAWEDASSLCMVSEFMCGGNLRSLLSAYAKSRHCNGHDDTKLRIAIQVAHGLTYLHSFCPPVIHRDLMSRNVLLTASVDAKIVDFGDSRERQDDTMTAGVGTALWMAPEVIAGDRYNEKADMYSFGVILSELDTHALPYDHARDATTGRALPDVVLLEMIRRGQVVPRFTVAANPGIVALARDCLQLDPRMRPTAADVLRRMAQCLRHDPTLTEQTRGLRNVGARKATRPNLTTQSTTFQVAFDTPTPISLEF